MKKNNFYLKDWSPRWYWTLKWKIINWVKKQYWKFISTLNLGLFLFLHYYNIFTVKIIVLLYKLFPRLSEKIWKKKLKTFEKKGLKRWN